MRPFLNQVRKAVRFILAAVMWLHALFVFHAPVPDLSRLGTRIQLTTSEAIVFALLLIFSALATYGWGRLTLDLIYIYFFPFVLLYIVGKWTILALIRVNKFCAAGTSIEFKLPTTPSVKVIQAPAQPPVEPQKAEEIQTRWEEVRSAVTRPFRRFTLLWCLLLLFTTHRHLLDVALAIVVVHVAFILAAILKVTVFSAGVLTNLEDRIKENTDTLLAKIASVTRETAATNDLRNIWLRIAGIQLGVAALRNKQLVSRWATILGFAFLTIVYMYVAFLFSFIYYGIAHAQSISLPWPSALVTSTFIPFAFGDLPSNIWLKLVGGIQCVIVLAVSASTVIGYMLRKAEGLQQVALVLTDRFAAEDVRARLSILEEKFKTPTASNPNPANQ